MVHPHSEFLTTVLDFTRILPTCCFIAAATRNIIQKFTCWFLTGMTVMGFKLDRVHVWSCEVADQAGGVAAKLSILAQAHANLEFIYTRRQPEKPGTGILHVAPITGPLQLRAAKSAGLSETNNPV